MPYSSCEYPQLTHLIVALNVLSQFGCGPLKIEFLSNNSAFDFLPMFMLNQEVNASLSDKELATRIANIGPLADPSMSVEDVRKFLATEFTRWSEVTKEIGVLAE